jgi:hypothetical protein
VKQFHLLNSLLIKSREIYSKNFFDIVCKYYFFYFNDKVIFFSYYCCFVGSPPSKQFFFVHNKKNRLSFKPV